MENKFWKWSKNETTGDRILRLDGVIHDWDFWDDLFGKDSDALNTPKEFRKELNSCDGDIVLEIYSPGGNYFAAAEIYKILRDYNGGKITAKIASYAASAATIIMCAANTVEVSSLAMLCIHNPFLDSVAGDEKDMLQAANYLAELKENIINIYEKKTGLSKEKISEMMDEETFMNAKKAVELHFADKFMLDDETKVGELTAEMYSTKQNVTSMLEHFKKINAKKISANNNPITLSDMTNFAQKIKSQIDYLKMQNSKVDDRVDGLQLQKRLNLISP